MTDADFPDETPAERKKRKNREWIAAKRAALSADERAAKRRAYDAAYRETHRAERQQYDRERNARLRDEDAA